MSDAPKSTKETSLAAETALAVISPRPHVLAVYVLILTSEGSSSSMQMRPGISIDTVMGHAVQTLGSTRAAQAGASKVEDYRIDLTPTPSENKN